MSRGPVEAYPLYWPEGWKRTQAHARKRNQNWRQLLFSSARDSVIAEIRRLGGSNVILSTNVPLRLDGLPYADMRNPTDPGVAVYFTYKKKPMCFACDQYHHVQENLRAIALTIEALRGIERWGASDMMERAFRGFTALPEQTGEPWRNVFGFSATETVTEDALDSKFRQLAHIHHPDKGGTPEQFQRIVNARNDARRALGLTV